MFFQPEPNSEILTNKIKYTLNNDGLNEKYDYSLDKPKDVFRIIALGDSQTFGLLVETKDNWTEVLEENLNKNNKCRNTKKFEVINLGVNGYDIQYAAHLFKLKGEKYQPDLVLWLIRKDNLYQLNELIIGEIIKYYKQAKNADELNGITKRINDFSIWGQISKELLTEFGGPQIFAKQRDFINYFIQSKKSNMVILFFGDFSAEEKKFIKKINIPRKDGIQIINGLDKKNYFTNFESLNNKGNKELADIIYEYFVDSRVIHCQK
ncbi:hypothetical protein GYA19_05880 [Candidatus Beckwithbacteria bacterium]|nr:hypothetical protein [Candidatus Beckwithbacteria bacterium]